MPGRTETRESHWMPAFVAPDMTSFVKLRNGCDFVTGTQDTSIELYSFAFDFKAIVGGGAENRMLGIDVAPTESSSPMSFWWRITRERQLGYCV